MKLLLLNVFVSLAITCSTFGQNISDTLKTDVHANEQIANNENVFEYPTNTDISKNCLKPNIGFVPPPHLTIGDGSTLTVYNENQNLNITNDNSYDPMFVPTEGIINGSLDIHSFGIYYEKIDQDWYRFSIEEKCNYTFNFTAPNSGYVCDIYRFSNNYYGTPETCKNHYLVKRLVSGVSGFYRATFECGTYFFCVTATSKVNVVYGSQYSLTYDCSKYVPSCTQLTLDDNLLAEKGIVIWENERIPAMRNQFNEEPKKLNRWINSDIEIWDYIREGCTYGLYNYLDPIYFQLEDWGPKYTNTEVKNEIVLDSIIYAADKESVRTIKDIVDGIRQKASYMAYMEHIQSLQIEYEENQAKVAEAITDFTIKIVIKYFTGPLSPLVEKVYDDIKTSITSMETIIALTNIIGFNGNSEYFVSGVDLGNNLAMLSVACDKILESDNPDKVLRIPRYAYLYNADGDGSHECVRWATDWLPKSQNLLEYSFFLVDKGTIVTRNQTMPITNLNDSGQIFKGEISTYTDFSSFWDATNPIVESSNTISDSNNWAKYSINKRIDGKYYLDVTNPSKYYNLKLMYNTQPVNDDEGKNFNFKADGYRFISIKNNKSTRICLEDRPYVWVRENAWDQVKKISFSSNQTSLSPLYDYGMKYLKLSVVGKVGTTWTIRVRNLSDMGAHFVYNKKMCFNDDAKYWRNLYDLPEETIYINYNEYCDVEISMNWFATSIAVSYIRGKKRYISYADGLDNGSKTLNYYTYSIAA